MTDFTKPGKEGQLPDGSNRPDRETAYYGTLLPKPLVCGKEYYLYIETNEHPLNCTGYNFSQLYNRAVEIAQKRINELKCPKECSPIHHWQNYRAWACYDLGKIRNAFLNLQIGILCPRETDTKKEGLGHPTDEALSKAKERGEYFDREYHKTDELIEEDYQHELKVPCPGEELVRFDYSEGTNSCEGVNFQPAVEIAEDRARFYYDLVECKPDCRKGPFRFLYREWACKEYHGGGVRTFRIVVTLFFRIVCVGA